MPCRVYGRRLTGVADARVAAIVRESTRDSWLLRPLVQTEAGAWSILSAINTTFANLLLISRGAGSIVLGIYNRGVNLFGFESGWVGPRLSVLGKFVVTIPILAASSVVRIGASIRIEAPSGAKFGRPFQASRSPATSPSGQE